MLRSVYRTARFAASWFGGRDSAIREEVTVSPAQRAPTAPAGGATEVTVYRPAGSSRGPGWVLLHGMTRTGRTHPSLVNFASALASTGATVVVPEVPEWVALDLAPSLTAHAVEAGLEALGRQPGVVGRPGLMGFSFGAPQVLRAATSPELASRLGCVAAVGGYGDLERTVHFLMTGWHTWEGRDYRVRPDPYGRWIVAANYLTGVPGYEGAHPVADALRALAAYAGDYVIESWDPRMDPVKAELEAGLSDRERDLFRVFAPEAEDDPPPRSPAMEAWAERLTTAGVTTDPSLAIPPTLEIPVPVVLLHGRNDHLIPFSESYRMRERIISPDTRLCVTRLFAHSTGEQGPDGRLAWLNEMRRLSSALGHLLTRV